MKRLDCVHQGRAVVFFEDVLANLDHIIGPHAKEMTIECRVMQTTEREPVPDSRLPLRLCIWDDVRGTPVDAAVPEPRP